ncbi:MAG: hypothetical protein KDD39_09630 [Bdellovibrionales bacterium]|nr:hypothetical protein [Bdellovibrionales bacterium]
MKYLVLAILTVFLSSCASTQQSREKANASNSGDKEMSQEKTTATSEKGSTGVTAVQCKWNTESRKIENKSQGEGCEVIYTKNGTAETVGSAASDLSVCENIAKKIQGNLESNGFKCDAI